MTQYYPDAVGNHLVAEASITAATMTEATVFDPRRPFNVSVSGTFDATVALQRSFDNGATWKDVWTTTVPAEKLVDTIEEDVQWKLGVRTGDYTSGTIVARMSQ